MNKVGILTHYYGSNNYGGVLQAYALVKVLRNMGYDAEQICFPYTYTAVLSENCIKSTKKNIKTINTMINSKSVSLPFKIYTHIKYSIYCRTKGRVLEKKEQNRTKHIVNDYFYPRKKAFEQFCNKVPHSFLEYTTNTLFYANEQYDSFITGSDQVWNLAWHTSAFFLEFADINKKKIAYAASAGNTQFDKIQQKYLKRVLPKYDAISVRESDLVDTYRDIAGIDAEFVLDPVLLLDRSEWDNVVSKRLIKEKYLFCFFYTPTEKPYILAKKYAKIHGLKIVTIPYAKLDSELRIDDDFGDYKIGNASPEDFVSLVKNAECVFTDSFHCNIFSILYDRPFFAFGRDGMQQMNSRIISLNKMFGCEDRFCDTNEKQTVTYLNSVKDVTYNFVNYNMTKEKSIAFLKKSLN